MSQVTTKYGIGDVVWVNHLVRPLGGPVTHIDVLSDGRIRYSVEGMYYYEDEVFDTAHEVALKLIHSACDRFKYELNALLEYLDKPLSLDFKLVSA